MTETTLEQAKRCPRCEQPGEQVRSTRAPGRIGLLGARVLTIECRNERCKWFDSSWLVQINPDGSIPEPNTSPNRDKAFPSLPPVPDEQRVIDRLAAQHEATMKPGAEVRGPR